VISAPIAPPSGIPPVTAARENARWLGLNQRESWIENRATIIITRPCEKRRMVKSQSEWVSGIKNGISS
jgi:hypothetical protein